MKKSKIFLKFMATSAAMVVISASAQNRRTYIDHAQIVGYSNETKLPNFIRFDQGHEIGSLQVEIWAATSLNINSSIKLLAYKTEMDELGYTHTRYQEYYNNYPIEGTTLISHSKNGVVVSINGDYIQEVQTSSAASLTEAQALQSALKKVNARVYQWQDANATALARVAHNDPSFTYYPKGELVIVHRSKADQSPGSYCLAYKFNVYAADPLYRANVFVDASTGEIVEEQNLICTADVVGTAVTKYSGTVDMTSDNYGTNQYRLRETGRGNGIETYNLKTGTTYINTDFTNASSAWTTTGNDQAAADAHWGSEKTYDYYKTTFNRNSIDNKGYKLLSYVHFNTKYVNAYWDGTQMTYGDGDISMGFNVMTALDVCGHEITHGLITNTANLGSGEAGALNEGFADIFGTTIEAYARPNQHDWIIGSDITCTTAGVPDHKGIRDMSAPKNFKQPDTYKGTNWDANGEVHKNNGPSIFWYYLMCEGKTGTNDNGDAYNVTGIGMADAAKIAFRALTVYFTSSTNYASARTYAIQAATDLFGSCGQQTITCTNAWYAVGVGAKYTAAAVASNFSANSTNSCSVPDSVHFLNTTVNGSAYTWAFGDGATSTQPNPLHVYTQAGTYTVKLTALGCDGTTKDSIIKTSYINVNPPASPTAPGTMGCRPFTCTLQATGTGTFTWTDSKGAVVGTGASFTTPALQDTTTYYVSSSTVTAAVTGAPEKNTTLGAGANLNASHYLIFNASTGFTLKTVDVYANDVTGSNPTITLSDSAGNVLASQPLTLTAKGLNTVTLNFHVSAGTGYRLAATGTDINLYRNSAGAVYPIDVASIASITGTDVSSTNPTYYYFFYNWVLQKDGCTSAATEVTVIVKVCTDIHTNSLTDLVIYPNPANDRFTITNITGTISLKAYDLTGKLIYQENKQSGISLEINTALWQQGVYFLSITHEGKTNYQKMIIQH
jgi:Zn-dependent metalloprotease